MQLDISLPAEVLDQLTPVLESLRTEVVSGVTAVAHQRVERAGKVAVRANGGSGSGHDRGFQAITADLFPPGTVTTVQSPSASPIDGKCNCTLCNEVDCNGECDACPDWGCEQCHEVQRCCGRCSVCQECHSSDHYTRNKHSNGDGVSFCTSCEHFCDDY